MSQEKDSNKKLSKAEQLLGRGEPEKKSLPEWTAPTELDFKDTKTSRFTTKIRFPILAKLFCSKLLGDRPKIEPRQYYRNLSHSLIDTQYDPLTIKTCDGAQISALSIGDPGADHCIIVFQGKDGNFQTNDSLQNLANIAKQTNTRVIAFNYRDTPLSRDSLIYDGAAVTRYVLSQGIPARNITLYGESLGAGAAAETAAKLLHEKDQTISVKAFIARPPKSLAYAGKLMNLKKLFDMTPATESMPEKEKQKIKKIISVIQKLQSNIPRSFAKGVIENLFGGDLKTEKALNQLEKENVTVLRVEEDLMIPYDATAGHDGVATTVCETDYADKHNAYLQNLKIKSSPEPSERGLKKPETALDLLRNVANPDHSKQAEKSAQSTVSTKK